MVRLRINGPRFRVTWPTKLLAGEESREWSAWFRAAHESGSWEQVPGDFHRAGWQMAHTAMVNEVRERWEEPGCTMFTGRQNHFALRGGAVTLGGQPDLVARMGETGAIIDAKTGNPSPSHLATRSFSTCTPCPGQSGGARAWSSTARWPVRTTSSTYRLRRR